MRSRSLAVLAAVAVTPAAAQDHREMDAHVHGVTTLELAIEGDRVQIALHAPGMDIVGFEYAAESDADKATVEAAVANLNQPERVVALPGSAACSPSEVSAELEAGEEPHDEHDDHADHAQEQDHEEHGGEHGHDDHDDEHGHDDHAEDDHAGHSEFHASYAFTCDNPEALSMVEFPFFDTFPNAERIEAQFLTETGAGSAQITSAAPRLSLK